MIVDASGIVAGRMASRIAKLLINGETVIVVNTEKALMVGNKESILEKFRTRVDGAVKSNPHYGPKYSRIPSQMFKRMVKGMLPKKSRTNERLLKQLKVYNSFPKQMEKEKVTHFDGVKYNEKQNHMTLENIAKLLGGKW